MTVVWVVYFYLVVAVTLVPAVALCMKAGNGSTRNVATLEGKKKQFRGDTMLVK